MKSFKRIALMVLAAILFFIPMALAESHEPLKLNDEQYRAVNLFLSNFTETGIAAIQNDSDDQDLISFAHAHLWFNDHNSFEYGEYDRDNNCRVKVDRIQEIIDKYFYLSKKVDLSGSDLDYDGKYYYHSETGGWCSCGFAITTGVSPLGNDEYFVSFMTFASGEAWDNDALELSVDQAWQKFGTPSAYGHALIYARDLADRSTYQMISYN